MDEPEAIKHPVSVKMAEEMKSKYGMSSDYDLYLSLNGALVQYRIAMISQERPPTKEVKNTLKRLEKNSQKIVDDLLEMPVWFESERYTDKLLEPLGRLIEEARFTVEYLTKHKRTKGDPALKMLLLLLMKIWGKGVGKAPSLTASTDDGGGVGPFFDFSKEVLGLVGVAKPDAALVKMFQRAKAEFADV